MTTLKFPLSRFTSQAVAIIVLALLLAPAARGQSADEFLHALINQKLILRNVGDQQEIKLKKNRLQSVTGSCDLAVLVQAAVGNRGKAGFLLENIGNPSVAGQQRRYCKMTYSNMLLEISGFARDETPDSLRDSLSQILLTPEQYLNTHGVSFDLPPGPDDEVVIKIPPPTRGIKPLLTVDPAFSEEARRLKHQGILSLSVVVGTDGRLHRVQVVRRLGDGLDEMALKAMPLWRFEPARQQDKPVATQTTVEVSFNLY